MSVCVVPRPRGPSGRGSALALVPAGFLVLIVLAAITVDSAVAFLGQHQLGDALAAAANDAAGAAISDSSFYGSGAVVVDPARAAAVVCRSVAAQDGGLHRLSIQIAVAGSVVGLRGTAEVDEVFGRDLPGARQREVRAAATAVAARGPLGSVAAPLIFHPVSCFS